MAKGKKLIDRIQSVSASLNEEKRDMETLVFEHRDNAVRAAELIKVEGVFSYSNEDGDTYWLPSENLKALSKHCTGKRGDGEDIYEYKDPITQEYFYFQRMGVHKNKDGRPLVYVGKSEGDLGKAINRFLAPHPKGH